MKTAEQYELEIAILQKEVLDLQAYLAYSEEANKDDNMMWAKKHGIYGWFDKTETRPVVSPGKQAGQNTHCSRGHEYNTENTTYHRSKKGTVSRRCTPCRLERLEEKRIGRLRVKANQSEQ